MRQSNERGVTTVFVLVFLSSVLLVLAVLIDISALLMRREQMITMAEMAAAAGGRVVAEAIAYAAGLQQPNPTDEELHQAARFVSLLDRAAIQDGTFIMQGVSVKTIVTDQILTYALANKPVRMVFDQADDLTIAYVPEPNDCADPGRATVEIVVNITNQYRFIFGGFLNALGINDSRFLAVSGTYQVVVCP